jgi:hypothetical protein
MSYSWQTPITDRTSVSYYNYTDLNRVDNNTRYIQEFMATYQAQTNLAAYVTKTNTSILRPAQLNNVELNIELLKSALGTPTGWITVKTNWTGGNAFVYTDANRLESNLALLKTMAENVKDALLYCGTFSCGSGNIEL